MIVSVFYGMTIHFQRKINLHFLLVMFGIISSLFWLNATIKYNLERYPNYAKNFVEKFLNDLYVDDLDFLMVKKHTILI